MLVLDQEIKIQSIKTTGIIVTLIFGFFGAGLHARGQDTTGTPAMKAPVSLSREQWEAVGWQWGGYTSHNGERYGVEQNNKACPYSGRIEILSGEIRVGG